MPDNLCNDSGQNAHRFAPAAPDEEYVFGACCPGWHSAGSHTDALESWLAFMRERGVERVCSLLPGPRNSDYVEPYREAFGAENVCRAPLADHQIADESTLEATVFPFLEASVDAEQRVVVYCLDGVGRTGQVLAAWLAHDRDVGPAEAIETVKAQGRLPDDPVRTGRATEAELVDLLQSFE
jgi:protein-tyrosine phosphatase